MSAFDYTDIVKFSMDSFLVIFENLTFTQHFNKGDETSRRFVLRIEACHRGPILAR